MSFVFANKLGEKVSESYNDPYDAFQNRNNKKQLCIVSDNLVLHILDTKMISIKWAVACANHVLHIFEEQYPDDKKPRQAIETAYNWIKDPSKKNRMACKDAAYTSNTSSGASAVAFSTVYTACIAYTSDTSDTAYAYAADYAYIAALNASSAAPDKSSEIKWQRKKLNQIVYEEILMLLVKSQYQRIDNKLVRKIPKELLEYIVSFIY